MNWTRATSVWAVGGPSARPADQDAVVASVDGHELTMAELDRWSNRMARMLLRLGAGPNLPVALAEVPEFEAVVVRRALAKIGAVAVPVSADVVSPAAHSGITVRAQRGRFTGATRWLVLDERETLQHYLSTSGEPLTDTELGSNRRAS